MANVCVCNRRFSTTGGFHRHLNKCFVHQSTRSIDLVNEVEDIPFELPDLEPQCETIQEIDSQPDHFAELPSVFGSDFISSDTEICDSLTYVNDQIQSQFTNDNIICSSTSETINNDAIVLKVASFANSAGLSIISIENLLKILHSKSNFDILPSTARAFQKMTQEVLMRKRLFNDERADDILSAEFDVSEVNLLEPKVVFYYRNPRTALITLLLRHAREPKNKLNWSFKDRRDPSTGERIFWGDNSGTWWADLEKTYLKPGCVPLVFKIFTDGTQTLSNCSQCPIVVTLSNFDPEMQSITDGKICIGYIPYINAVGAKKSAITRVRLQLYHWCMALIGSLIWPKNLPNYTHILVRNEVLTLQIFCKNIIVDGPENRKVSMVGSQCPRCLSVKDTFDNQRTSSPRLASSMASYFDEATDLLKRRKSQNDGTMSKIDNLKKESGLSLVLDANAFWSWHFGCPEGVYAALAFDRLHIIKGLIGNLVTALNFIVASEGTATTKEGIDAYVSSQQAKMDARFAKCPAYLGGNNVYLPRLKGGFYSKKRAEAWHFSLWLSLIPFVVSDDEVILKSAALRSKFIENATLLLIVVNTVWKSVLTNDEMEHLAEEISEWEQHFKEHFLDSSKSKCCFDNFHRILHAPEQGKRDGGFSVTCTASFEQSHVKFAKQPARRHNRKGFVEKTMLTVLRNADQIGAALLELYSDDDDEAHSSSTHSNSTASGSVTRVRSGLMVYMYFRDLNVTLPEFAERYWLREVQTAYNHESNQENDDPVTADELFCWRFLRFRKIGTTNGIIIRSPNGGNITCIDNGDDSYAQVLSIIDVRNITLLLVRWFTPRFDGSRPAASRVVQRRYKQLKLTNSVVAIPLDHIQGTVNIVPNFSMMPSGSFFFVNSTPLGSKIRPRDWESELHESEREHGIEETKQMNAETKLDEE
jgi:hypothetical protein